MIRDIIISTYLSSPKGPSDELHVINTSTLAITDVGSLGALAFTGLIFGNTLYTTDDTNVYSYSVSPSSVTLLTTHPRQRARRR